MQKDLSKGFLAFTKKEKRGVMAILLAVMFIYTCSKFVYPLILGSPPVSKENISTAIAFLKQQPADSLRMHYPKRSFESDQNYHPDKKYEDENTSQGSLFYFDPNTIDATGWQKLGLRDKTIATIQNYLTKGGRFREAGDITKIWGLRDEEKQRLMPYVKIAASPAPENNSIVAYKPYEKKSFESKGSRIVDVNEGDSAAFVSLPGIGAGFSKRIMNFRDKLGGFYNIDQVGETFGMPDSVFQKIKPLLIISGSVRKININTASGDELKAHPYIRWQLSALIISYRSQHGNFKLPEDLKKIMALDEAAYNKMAPYITL